MAQEIQTIYQNDGIAAEVQIPDAFISEPRSGYQEDRDFTSLVAWQNSRNVKLFCYQQLVPCLPGSEKFNLKSQIERATVSVTANIAEGYGRFHYRESVQFYRISRGSLYELKDHLLTCKDIEYVDEKLMQEGLKKIEAAKISLNGFINFVRSKFEKKQ